MKMKIKVTYIGYGIEAKIFEIYGWYDLSNKLNNYGITDNYVIKVERILEADADKIVDTTSI